MQFQIAGIFERDDFEIELPVQTLEAASGEEVNQYVRNANLGRVFYDPDGARLCYLKPGSKMRELHDGEDCRCAVLRPFNKSQEYMARVPLYEEDFQETSFAHFLTMLSEKVPPGRRAFFECIAYALTTCSDAAALKNADKKKGSEHHAVH